MHVIKLTRIKNMRKLIFLLIPLLFIALPLASYGEEDSTISKPAVYGVMFYADWCGSCKALDPKVSEARKNAELDTQDVLFVTLDLTDDVTKYQSSLMATSLGINDVYESNAGKTGFMLLLDAESGEKISLLTNKLEVSEIATRIQEAIKSVKS